MSRKNMKRMLLTAFVFALMFLIPVSVAFDPTGRFQLRTASTCALAESNFYVNSSGSIQGLKSATENLVIPSEIDKIPIDTIGAFAFKLESSIVSVSIPSCISFVGTNAFSYCSSLTNVTIDNGLTYIGEMMFFMCQKLKDISLPLSIERIGSAAFSYCDALTSISIPPRVVDIDDYAFSQNRGLSSIAIPASVTHLGREAFRGCTRLTSLTIYAPNDITNIEPYAFYECYSLKDLILPGTEAPTYDIFSELYLENLTTIHCYKNTEVDRWAQETGYEIVYLDDKVPLSIGPVTVVNSDNLHLGDSFTVNCEVSGGDYTIDRVSVSIFKDGGAHGVILDTVPVNAGSYSVSSMTGLKIPESYTCEVCKVTETFDKDEYVTVVVYAYSDAYGEFLEGETSFTLVPKATADTSAFTIDATGTITKYTGTEADLVIPTEINGIKVTDIGGSAFLGNSYLRSVVIQDGVSAIGKQAFDYCDNLESVEIPSSVSFIGGWAFDDCPSLTKVVIRARTTEFSNNAIFSDTATIHCYKNSDAEAYAQRNGHEIVYLDGQCTVCNEADGPYQMNKVNATCTTPASWDDVYYCSVCGNQSNVYHVETDEYAEHNQEDGPYQTNKVNATCTAPASWDDEYYCTVCGQLSASYHVKTTEYAGHNQDIGPVQVDKVNATCKTPGSWYDAYYCSVCN